MSQKPPGFKNDALKAGLSQWKNEAKRASPSSASAGPKAAPAPPRPRTRAASLDAGDESLFLLAMEDVQPVTRHTSGEGKEQPQEGRSLTRAQEDALALAELCELTSSPPLTFVPTGDRCSGAAAGVDEALLGHLRAGHFQTSPTEPIQPLRPFAEQAERALAGSRRSGMRCARLTLEPGQWDAAAVSTWAPRLKTFFARPTIGRIVLAWSTSDSGGARSLDVILRR